MIRIADIRSRGPVLRSSSTLLTGKYLHLFFACIILTPILTGGCSHTDEGRQARSISQEANDFFNQGKYEESLRNYELILEKYPSTADRVLFEMGIIYAYPENEQKDYQKSLECFQKVVSDYPDSKYRQGSQMMILQINNVIMKDNIIALQQAQIKNSRQAVKGKENEIDILQEKIETLEQQIEGLEEKIFALRLPADKVLIEKKERRLTLLSKGEVIKTYRVALGANPVGPKERQGDNKTPEGVYIIDSRNGNSGYHLALHISYPNKRDIRRAKELGVSPGGDIMIHGLKNGFSLVGASHAEVDWTNGCIAVTNQEMEEIYKFVPIGTTVVIKP